MSGVGITFNSKEGERTQDQAARSTPLTNLPAHIAEAVSQALGIETDETKQALLSGKIDFPENMEVTITRKKTGVALTLKKSGGQFELISKGDRRILPAVPPGR